MFHLLFHFVRNFLNSKIIHIFLWWSSKTAEDFMRANNLARASTWFLNHIMYKITNPANQYTWHWRTWICGIASRLAIGWYRTLGNQISYIWHTTDGYILYMFNVDSKWNFVHSWVIIILKFSSNKHWYIVSLAVNRPPLKSENTFWMIGFEISDTQLSP